MFTDENESVNKDAEVDEKDGLLEALESTAFKIARNLPPERKASIHRKMLSQELNTFVRKVHWLNTMFGGMSDSAHLGVIVDKLFYEVNMETREFESDSEAADYAQQREEQIKASKK